MHSGRANVENVSTGSFRRPPKRVFFVGIVGINLE
jgi:hypothetical protein